MLKRTPAEILANLRNYDKEIEPCYKMAPEEVESLIEILENTKGWLYKYDGHQDIASTYHDVECLCIDRATGELYIDRYDVRCGLFWNDKLDKAYKSVPTPDMVRDTALLWNDRLDKRRYKVLAWRKP